MAWSRVFFNKDVVIALNTNGVKTMKTHISLDPRFHDEGSSMQVLYRSDWTDKELKKPPLKRFVPVEHIGREATVQVELPPAGMTILA